MNNCQDFSKSVKGRGRGKGGEEGESERKEGREGREGKREERIISSKSCSHQNRNIKKFTKELEIFLSNIYKLFPLISACSFTIIHSKTMNAMFSFV